MVRKGNVFNKIAEMVGTDSPNIRIMQEQIDVQLQLKYYKLAKELKKTIDKDYNYLKDIDTIFDDTISLEKKKHLICSIALIDKVENFRAIEQLINKVDDDLKPWITLALQSSRMLLEASFLDDVPLYISTGLGGKDEALRYCIVLGNILGDSFTDVQKKMISNELEHSMSTCSGEVEEMSFDDEYAIAIVLAPLKIDLYSLVVDMVKECNTYGSFIDEDIIISNVKKLEKSEIDKIVNNSTKTVSEITVEMMGKNSSDDEIDNTDIFDFDDDGDDDDFDFDDDDGSDDSFM